MSLNLSNYILITHIYIDILYITYYIYILYYIYIICISPYVWLPGNLSAMTQVIPMGHGFEERSVTTWRRSTPCRAVFVFFLGGHCFRARIMHRLVDKHIDML